MKTVTIRDKDDGKIVKQFEMPDDVADILDNIGGLNMGNFFEYEIK
jgi:hypothetical protein